MEIYLGLVFRVDFRGTNGFSFLKAEAYVQETESYLDSVMDRAMAKFCRFAEEMETECKAEHDSLVNVDDKSRKKGTTLEKAASFASMKYVEAAMNSATASMKSAVQAITSGSNKVHAE